jgi:hypothetical protein
VKRRATALSLLHENILFAGTGGRSEENSGLGFRAAFLDFESMTIYPSCFRDGRPAPMHLLDGLPDEVVVDRAASGRVVTAKATLVSGFERNGFFYTRSAAARAAAEWGTPDAP